MISLYVPGKKWTLYTFGSVLAIFGVVALVSHLGLLSF